MTVDPRVALRQLLGEDLEVLRVLTDQESADLLALVEQVRRDRQQALRAAIEEALCHLPWLLRGTARKIALGWGTS
jgi:hypothetical protein